MWRTALRVSWLSLRTPGTIYRPVRLPCLSPAVEQRCVRREYSSQGPEPKKMMVISLPNPFIWVRTRIYVLLIQTFLDQEFSLKEFNEGARQAFLFVSRMLSQKKFDALENLVAKEVLKDLEEKCSGLSDNHREALAAESDEILYLSPGNFGVYYGENETKFVNILVRFWYLKNVDLRDDEPEETDVYGMLKGLRNAKERILTATYEFRREFTPGVKPEWTITHIEHSKL
ncbi:m-AAA protease-interacting protein 1, mitochondrial [Lithobates pipiens]